MKIIALVPIILAVIIYLLLAFIYASFDITRYDKESKVTASFFWLMVSIVIIGNYSPEQPNKDKLKNP